MKRIITFYVCSLLVFSQACKTDDDADLKLVGSEYYPLTLNQESIFEIDSILYNDFTGRVDTIRLQRRELVERKNLDQEMREAFIIGIYERAAASLPWIKIREIRKVKTAIRLEITENNLVLLPLVFPITNDKTWNVNSLNTENKVEYAYDKAHQSFSLNMMLYDSTVTVNQMDEENLIERKFSEEIYAINRGLIQRTVIDLETKVNGEIVKGFEANTRLLSFKPF